MNKYTLSVLLKVFDGTHIHGVAIVAEVHLVSDRLVGRGSAGLRRRNCLLGRVSGAGTSPHRF